MVDSENCLAIREHYKLLREGRKDEAAGLLDENIEWVEPAIPGSPPRIVHGRQAVVTEVWGSLGGGFSEVKIEPEEFFDAGDAVLVVGAFRGTTSSDSTPFAIDFVHVWKFRDGKVTYMRTVADTAAYMAAQGLLGKMSP